MTDDDLTVDDLVTGKAAEQLGDGLIPTKAILIVETMSETGNSLRYVVSEGVPSWLAIGMLRSTQLSLEAMDLDTWGGDDG